MVVLVLGYALLDCTLSKDRDFIQKKLDNFNVIHQTGKDE